VLGLAWSPRMADIDPELAKIESFVEFVHFLVDPSADAVTTEVPIKSFWWTLWVGFVGGNCGSMGGICGSVGGICGCVGGICAELGKFGQKSDLFSKKKKKMGLSKKNKKKWDCQKNKSDFVWIFFDRIVITSQGLLFELLKLKKAKRA
jgi:hypothetical protein